MVIDFRKPKILKGLISKRGRYSAQRIRWIGAAVSHLFEQRSKLGCIV
ncbi:MAG TPA: hypothetical protein VFV51_11445 [Vicinamibacterales bacterium]|nr:hypothetical protein [Vicinamibacterales bacterium]